MADDPNAARRRAARRDRDADVAGEVAPSDAGGAEAPTDPTDAASPNSTGSSGGAGSPVTAEPEPTPASAEASEPVEAAASAGPTPDVEASEPLEAAAGAGPTPDVEPAADAAEGLPADTAHAAEQPTAAVDAAEGEPTDPAADAGAVPGAAAATATTLWESPDGTPTASLPWLQARSPDDRICPFLRAVAADEHLGFPVESPDASNRCASMHEAVPQSLRQQELVCLTANHVNCPRYLRGAAETATVVPVARVRPKAVMTPAISAALIILALSFGASVAFGLANGGLAMPSRAAVAPPSPSATSIAADATASPAASSPTPAPAAASPSLAATPVPSATAAPTPAPSATLVPSPSPSIATGPTPSPTSNRFRLLKPCPNKPNCWIYTVRAGDNLYSIANYFGVPLTTVRRLNPWTRTESLRAGKKLILPNPTR